ncbi:MAG: hypothetical protein Q8Q09_07965, partial [Deltaproteobacteria bacterium]|nr:hypothetical protein [Deltaproteobacteria bacterium]
CATGFGDCDGSAANGCEVNVRTTDVNNCGGCGLRCSFANAASSCAMGACAMGACNAGFADCDGNPANGCEVNVTSDNGNCGVCGTACAAGRVCSAGTCQTSCGTGLTACSGACVNTANDPANCNMCGSACASVTNATSVCASSACRFVCDGSFADCDRNAANGCEVNTSNNSSNCGTCGRACVAGANQIATCSGGACNNVCATGFADCDGNPANGCEVNLLSTPANCGACGNVCAAAQGCFVGVCRAYVAGALAPMAMADFRNACTTVGSTVLATTGDDVLYTGSIGFSMPFYNATFTQFQADTNGNVQLGTTGASSLSNSCALSGATRTNILALLWDDMNLSRSGATGLHRICTVTTGAAPNREWVVTYEEVPYFTSSTPVTSAATYSSIVRETTGAITYQYLLNAFNASATVGLRGTTAAQTAVPMTPACNTVATLDAQQLQFTLTP